MKKKTKKIIAIICAIAMVVSSMTITHTDRVKAVDYSSLDYTKYSFTVDGKTYGVAPLEDWSFQGVNIDTPAARNRIFMTFLYNTGSKVNPSPAYTNIKLNNSDLDTSDNMHNVGGNWLGVFIDELTYNTYNVLEATAASGDVFHVIIKAGNPSSGGSGESSSSTTTVAGGEVTYDWKLLPVTGECTAYQNNFYYDTKTYKGFNVIDNIRLYQTKPCLYLGAKTDLVDSLSINGNVATKGTDYFMAASEMYLNMESMTSAINVVDVTYGGTLGTAKIIIKNSTVTTETTTVAPTETTTTPLVVNPVTNVVATGGVRQISVTWDKPVDVKEGTQYYVYLDDEATERTIVNANSATLTDISVGPHIVKVKAYYDGVFSTVAESAQTQVVGSGVANLSVSSTKPNTVQVQWSNESDATYQLELVNSLGTTVDTINDGDITVDSTLRKYEFTGVAKGTYTIKVTASYAGVATTPVESESINVVDLQPVNLASLEGNVDTAEQIALRWTVNNPTEGQTYKVYLDSNEAIAVGTNTYTYLLENVSAGSHTVKVTAVYGVYETEGKTIQVTVKAKPVRKFETELAQVTTSGTVKENDTWSYEFANQSADAMFAVDKDNAFIAYLPTYAGADLDKVYETVTGLEIGKTYTYTYRVDTDVAGNNIPVVASMENGDSDSYELTAITTDGVSVTKKFTATATTMQLAYTLGFVNNKAAVKISKATITELQPTDITGLTAEGGIETINLSWACDDAVEEQAYNIYLDGSDAPIASGVLTKTYTLEGVAKGTHSVTVKAILNGVETSGMTVENITVTKVEVAITSDSITVEGFQIKTNNPENTVGFRTICKAPNKGSQIVASDDVTYTVESMGTIYTLDPNTDGYRKNDVLNASYTILNPTPVSEKSYSYVGASLYNDAQRTYGYLATENAIVTSWNPSDTTNTYYVRTMLGMSEYTMLENSIHVRAFVVATDGTIIYSKKTACISVAEVADHLYKNSKSNNYTAHKYLYSSILNKVSNTNPYYRDATLPYGWDSQLFTPSNPTFTLTYGT